MTTKKKNEVVTTNGNEQLPAYLQEFKGPTGTENIQSEDITIPRLKIGQDMSPEVQEGDVDRGDLFLNVTGEVINPAGSRLPFIVLAYGKEYILWRPKKDNGGGILARARPERQEDGSVRYRWDKPNESFDVKVEGITKVTWKTGEYIDEDGLNEWGSEIPGDNSSKKAATEHHNYIVLLPETGIVTALSLSKTATGKAKDFNAMLKMGSAPLQSRIFTVETIDDQRDNNKFKNYKFRPAGFVQDAETFKRYEGMAATFKYREVDHSDGEEAAEKDERA